VTVRVLNVVIRPYTAHWHKQSEDGSLTTEDGRHAFRAQLQRLQTKLRLFQRFLGRLAEGDAFRSGSESGLEEIEGQSFELGSPIPYDQLLGLNEDVGKAVVTKERDEIDRRRRRIGVGNGSENLVGLAISGGGIRSATFALGAVQGLARQDLLKEVDLLSTVSGGGYLGSFLSSFWNDAETPVDSNPEIGPGKDQLPFRREEKCESRPLRFLRNHSKYLRPRGFSGGLTMVAQGLYGMVMNLVILLPFLIAAVIVTAVLHKGQFPAVARALENNHFLVWQPWGTTLWFGGIWGVLVLLLPLVQKVMRLFDRGRQARTAYEYVCLVSFGVLLVVGGANLIPACYYAFLWISAKLTLYTPSEHEFQPRAIWAAVTNAVAFFAAKGLLWKSDKTDKETVQQVSLIRRLMFHALWLAGPLLMVVVYFLLCHWLLSVPGPEYDVPVIGKSARLALVGILAAFLLLYTFGLLNVNLISPYRYYRNRLVETYLLRHQPDAALNAGVASVDPQRLSDLNRTEKSPYHLINSAVNLPASQQPELRGRNSDFFLFSKHFVGSPIIGYQATDEWERYGGYLDVGTAMAISGAAASPHMGAATPTGASFFLTLLNVRLGAWLRRPGVGIWPAPLVKAFGGPGPFYLLREMFGWVHEKAAYINVSDGGHIENLGVYELLRRRCKFIVAIDGECDPDLEFFSLMQLLRYAWIDFGVKIDIDVDELRLTPARFSQAHSALGRIQYHTGETGFLLYLKLSVTGNELPYVLDYRRQNPAFPHQSTTDQLFEEDQYEAYRALGSHVAEELFREELLGAGGGTGLTVSTWFERLGRSFLGV
jgi:hypothetical protein